MTYKQKLWAIKEIINNSPITKQGAEETLAEVISIVEQRDYGYLHVGTQVYWKDPEDRTSGLYNIIAVYKDVNVDFSDDTIVILSNGYSELEAPASELYLPMLEKCPKCGRRMFLSDVVGYDYVCLHCDENF